MKWLVFFLEEPSAKEMLEGILPVVLFVLKESASILPGWEINCVANCPLTMIQL